MKSYTQHSITFFIVLNSKINNNLLSNKVATLVHNLKLLIITYVVEVIFLIKQMNPNPINNYKLNYFQKSFLFPLKTRVVNLCTSTDF